MKTVIVTADPLFSADIADALIASGIGSTPQRVTDISALQEIIPTSAAGILVVIDVRNENAAMKAIELLSGSTEAVIIAAGCAERPIDALSFIRAGAHDYIDVRTSIKDEMKAALERRNVRRGTGPARGRLVTVTSCGGGSGASTIAVNLAAILATESGNCALVDLHPCGGDLAAMLQLEPDFTLLDLAKKGEALDPTLLHKSLVRHSSGICLLASPNPYREDRYVPTKVVQRILALALKEFPYVIVDGEDAFHHEQLTTIKESDVIVLAFRLDFASLARAKKCLTQLTNKEGVSLERIRLVAGRTGQPRELSVLSAEKVLGSTVAQCIPYDPANAFAAVNIGAPVAIESPTSNIARAISNLASQVSDAPKETLDRKEQFSKRVVAGAASLLRIASF
jgi:pilus assembly protein CpaE